MLAACQGQRLWIPEGCRNRGVSLVQSIFGELRGSSRIELGNRGVRLGVVGAVGCDRMARWVRTDPCMMWAGSVRTHGVVPRVCFDTVGLPGPIGGAVPPKLASLVHVTTGLAIADLPVRPAAGAVSAARFRLSVVGKKPTRLPLTGIPQQSRAPI